MSGHPGMEALVQRAGDGAQEHDLHGDLEVIEEDGQIADADLGPGRRRRREQGQDEGAEDKGALGHGAPLYRSLGDGSDEEG